MLSNRCRKLAKWLFSMVAGSTAFAACMGLQFTRR